MSGRKRKNATSSDFKRVKAKVGKRVQRQSDTDVSFRSASLHLGQSIQGDDEPKKIGNLSLLVSSKGKSLCHLVSTASTHPAATVRASSLKGILDIVKKHPTELLSPNLSTLIPICVHSCVDEDQDVRSVGMDALSSILQRLEEKNIKPFGPLLIARMSSALHSLDSSIRVNGIKMVNLTSTTCPSLIISFIDKLLPPFSALLADQRTKKSIDEILQSLISVLRLHTTRYDIVSASSPSRFHTSSNCGDRDFEVRRNRNDQPHLFYVPGGYSRNAILRTKRSVQGLSDAMESISHLSRLERSTSSCFNMQKNLAKSSRHPRSHEFFWSKCRTALMSKLRDCLIESINLEREPTTEPEGRTNFPRVVVLLRSIRYLYNSFAFENEEISDDDKIEFDKATEQIISVLMDIFPFEKDQTAFSSVKDCNSTSIDDVNAAIAISVLDITQKRDTNNGMGENGSTTKWMKTICSYVIPRIGHLTSDETVSSSPNLDMVCKFLRRLGLDPAFANDLDSVLGPMQDQFFLKDAHWARSIAGRRISMIIMELIVFKDVSLTDDLKSYFNQFVMIIPFYLEAWATDFVYESRSLLEGLHRLVREVKGSFDTPLVESIRGNWCKLVANRGDSLSIFELYPRKLQKVYLSLVVLLEKPSDESLKYLASICCRSTLKNDKFETNETTSQLIVEAIKKTRKSIPMQRYLTFLFQSVGISRHVTEVLHFETISADQDSDPCSKTVFEGPFFAADSHLRRVAKVLVEPGSLKILRMILPQLYSWQQTKKNDFTTSTEFLLKVRASYIILAYFFLVEDPKEGNKDGDQPSILGIIQGEITVDTLAHSICAFISCIASNKDAMEFHMKLTSPVVAMMMAQPIVFGAVICIIRDLFRKSCLPKREQKNYTLILADWIKDPRLKDPTTDLLSSPKQIMERLLTNSPNLLEETELLPPTTGINELIYQNT